jgi:hypothetical protein
MKKALAFALPLILALAARPASAMVTITPGTDGIEAISGGVFELGLDNILLVRYSSTTTPTPLGDVDSSLLEATYAGGLTPRYFLIDNLSLAANLQIFYGRTTSDEGGLTDTSSDLGFLGIVLANYYVRLGYGMFFAPGIGGGGFYGTRRRPGATAGTSIDAALYGGAIKLDLGFVFYAGTHFNLKGGPELLCRFGSVKEDVAGAEAGSLLTIEAGFHIGLAYSI